MVIECPIKIKIFWHFLTSKMLFYSQKSKFLPKTKKCYLSYLAYIQIYRSD